MHQIKQYGYHIDIIEIIAMEPATIEAALNDVDAIVFGGGNCFYLSYWMQKKGMFDFLPKLIETKVYVGIRSVA